MTFAEFMAHLSDLICAKRIDAKYLSTIADRVGKNLNVSLDGAIINIHRNPTEMIPLAVDYMKQDGRW